MQLKGETLSGMRHGASFVQWGSAVYSSFSVLASKLKRFASGSIGEQ